MDVEGCFNSTFTIKSQPFGEQFKVVLDSSVSVFDKNGDLKGTVSRSKLVSNWIFAEESITKKITKGLDISHLVFDQSQDKRNGKEKEMTDTQRNGANLDLISNDLNGNYHSDTPKENTGKFARINVVLEVVSFQIRPCNDERIKFQDSKETPGSKDVDINKSVQNRVRDFIIGKTKCVNRTVTSHVGNVVENGNDHHISEDNRRSSDSSRKRVSHNDSNVSDCDSDYTDGKFGTDNYSALTSKIHKSKSKRNCHSRKHPPFCLTKDKSPDAHVVEALEMEVYQSDSEPGSENSDTNDEHNNDSEEHSQSVIEMPHATENDTIISPVDTMSNIYIKEEWSPEESNEEAESNRRYPKRRRKRRVTCLQNFYVNDEILKEDILSTDEDDDHDKKVKKVKSKHKSKKEDSDAEYVPSDEFQSIKSDNEEEACPNVETELENETSKSAEKVDLTKIAIERYKNELISQGRESKIPVGEMDPGVLLSKLKLEVKYSKRIKVKLVDHTDKYEIKYITSNEQQLRNVKAEEKTYESFACKICNIYQAGTEERMRNHIEQHLNGELKCKWCGVELGYIGEKRVHFKTNHPEKYGKKPKKKDDKVCDLCGHRGSEGNEWKQHMYKAHGIPSFDCRNCTEIFPSHRKYVLHMRSAHPDQLHTCENCNRLFIEKGNWTFHSARCKGEMPMASSNTCHVCGETLSSLAALRNHIRCKHQKEKLHKCTECSYACYATQRMRKHIDAHFGNKKFKCTVCDFATVQGYQLTSHMRIHTKEKPFKCDQCTYASAWNVQLKTHKKVHELDNTVTCGCGVVLKDTRALNRHKKKDHTEEGKKEERDEISDAEMEVQDMLYRTPLQ